MVDVFEPVTEEQPCALVLDGVTREFGALRAVDGVTFSVAPGERRAVIGPNGAGKTTLFNCITGELALSEGKVVLFDKDISKMSTHRRVALGLGRTFQITNVFPGLTVEENVFLSAQGLSKMKLNFLRSVPSKGEVRERALKALDLETARTVLAMLAKLNRQLGKTVLIITHNAAIARIAERIVRIGSGTIAEAAVNPERVPPQEIAW